MQAPNTNKEKRTFEKGVDMDSAIIGIEDGFARYMLNCLVDEGVNITNIKGNLVAEFEDGFTFFEDNINFDYRCIGAKYDPIFQKTYFFVVASTGTTSPNYYSFIFEYDVASGIVYVVCGNEWSDILDFDFDELITGISVVFINTTTPLLYWTQRSGLRKINVYKAKLLYSSAGADPLGYPSSSLQIIERIKYQPYNPPTIYQCTDKTVFVNNIEKRFFQFSYRYVYDDYEKSAPSEWSDVNVPYFETSVTPFGSNNYLLYKGSQRNNLINVTFNTGGFLVKKIELIVRRKISDGGVEANLDWIIYDTLDKEALGYNDNEDVVYKFYNDKVGELITQEQANRIFDNVPLAAAADTFAEGFRMYEGNVTEGFDLEPIDASVEFGQDTSGVLLDIFAVETHAGHLRGVGKLPTTSPFSLGDTIVFNFVSVVYPVYIYEYIVSNGDLDNYPTSLMNSINADFTANKPEPALSFTIVAPYTFYIDDGIVPTGVNEQIRSAFIEFNNNQIKKTFTNHTNQFLGLFYFDWAGRRSSVQKIENCFVSIDSQTGSIYADISISNTPPLWAAFYGIAFGGDSIGNIYSMIVTNAVKNADTSFTVKTDYFQTYDGADYTFIVYEYSVGDRIRITTSLGVVDLAIIAADTTNDTITFEYDNWVNIDVVDLSVTDFTATIYKQKTFNGVYTTIYKGEIGDAQLSTRYHIGNIQDQDYSTSPLPAISRVRGASCYWRGRVSLSTVEDRNQSDFYQSAVTSFGKPNIVNDNFRQVTRENTIWFSEQLIPESNTNGLSSFPDGQFRDYSQSFGGIQKFVVTDRALKVGMELRWGWIPINQQVNASGAEQTFTLNSSSVLTEMIYYEEKRGVGKHPESVVEFAGAIYGLDPITGCIYRISRDGFTIISDVKNQQGNYLVRQSLYDAIKAHTGNFWGGFNERRNSYEINIGGTVMVWDEEGNSWVGGRSYDAECFGSAGVDLVSFYNGRLYLHEANELRNNFYGVQYTSKVWVPGNWMDFKKIYKSLILRSETIWYAYDILNDIGQKSIIDKLRFSKREGMWYAAFRRDMNTVNVVNPIVDGKQMRDTVILLKMENDSVEYEWLNFVIINQIESK